MNEKPRSTGRLLYAGAVGLAFLGTGLYFAGAAGRVHALARAALSSPPIPAIEGSRVLSVQDGAMDGQPVRLARCEAPRGATVQSIREFYEGVARREGTVAEGDRALVQGLPYLAVDQPGGAFVLWTHAASAHRRGVIVQGEASGIEYVLVDAPALAPETRDEALTLAGGIRAPAGARRGLDVQDGSQGWSFFELRGSPQKAAVELAAAATAAGYVVDAEAKGDWDELRAQSRGASSRVVVPFEGKGRRGVFIVSPTADGGSRATLALR